MHQRTQLLAQGSRQIAVGHQLFEQTTERANLQTLESRTRRAARRVERGSTKITEQGPTPAIVQDIVTVEIAMQDATTVQMRSHRSHLFGYAQHGWQRQGNPAS